MIKTMYQKCPICLGTGITLEDTPNPLTKISYPCPTCKGTRIISEVTGLPPNNGFSPLPKNKDLYDQFLKDKNTNLATDNIDKQSDYLEKVKITYQQLEKEVDKKEASENKDSSKYAKHTPTSTKIRHFNSAIDILLEHLKYYNGINNEYTTQLKKYLEYITGTRNGLLKTKDTD